MNSSRTTNADSNLNWNGCRLDRILRGCNIDRIMLFDHVQYIAYICWNEYSSLELKQLSTAT